MFVAGLFCGIVLAVLVASPSQPLAPSSQQSIAAQTAPPPARQLSSALPEETARLPVGTFSLPVILVLIIPLVIALVLGLVTGRRAKAAGKSLEDEIGERRRTETALRESEERYRVIVETAMDAVITIDEDSTIRFVNPAAERIFGHTRAQMLGQSLTMLIPAWWHVHLPVPGERRIGWNAITLPGLHQSGKEIPLELSFGEFRMDGKRSFTGIVRDISERKQAEEVLRQSQEQYRLLFQLNPHQMWVYDTVSLRFLAVNNAACQDYGYRADEFLGMTLSDICLADGTPSRPDAIPLDTYKPAAAAIRHYKKKGGAILTAEVAEHPIRFAGQDACLVMATDITERKRLEEQFHHAQRMESIGRLAGGVAHDFNNLLTVINGHTEMITGRLPADHPIRDSLGGIREAGASAVALTRQLLAFSKQQLVQPGVVNINTIVLDVQKMLGRLIGEDIDLRTNLAPDLGNVLVDVGQIQQVILNLAVNSRDAMPDGGMLLIETGNVTFDQNYANAHPGVKQVPHVMLSVTDTGIGMTPEVQDRIFEPFFTTKSQGVGTGLGLATVYDVVKQAGGWIWIYSEPGRGTTFKIYFPRVDLPLPEAQAIVTADVRGDETVLVVEDQLAVRHLAVAALQKYGYTAYGAASGDEALEFTRNFAGAIDLVVTDVVMPGMNGRELARQLTQQRPQARVLFMSGYTDDVIVHYGVLEAGAACLKKPFTPESLGEKVREVLGPRRQAAPTVLIVDHEDSIRKLLRRLLTNAGYAVLEAGNGRQALEQLTTTAKVDLAITELVMPEREGLETIRLLRDQHPDIKIIAISGAFGGALFKVAARFGAIVTLEKPINPEDLLQAARQALQA